MRSTPSSRTRAVRLIGPFDRLRPAQHGHGRRRGTARDIGDPHVHCGDKARTWEGRIGFSFLNNIATFWDCLKRNAPPKSLCCAFLSAANRFPLSVRSSIRATRPRARTHTAPSRISQNWTLPSPGGGAGRCAGCARGRAARGGGVPRLAGAGVSVGSTGAGSIIGTGRGRNRSPGTRLPGSSAAATRADIEKPSTAR